MSPASQAAAAQKQATSQGERPPQPKANEKAKGFAGLGGHLVNIYRLVIKELRSIRSDRIMPVLVAYSFTIAIYAVATGASTEATNLAVAIVDEDHSDLSRQIADGLTPPTFKPAVEIAATQIDASMDSQRFVFVIEIPPKFEADILAGRQPTVQVNVDATAVAQAFNGMTYIENVIVNYVAAFLTGREGVMDVPVKMVTRAKFNPNLKSSWFSSVMQVINNLTMLTVILTGAALIREREQGTVEHLLVMPVVPAEIMLSKILANGLVILAAAEISLLLVVQWWLQVPIAGSTLLFLFGSFFYVFTVGALGILLGTVAATMGQFGLLAIPVLLVMMLLSGGTTPMESMPVWLQYLMKVISPTPHFVVFAEDVLFRGADLSIVWPQILATAVIGAVYFSFALRRFRSVIFGG
jgi:ABC-2 type transport system permease protein